MKLFWLDDLNQTADYEQEELSCHVNLSATITKYDGCFFVPGQIYIIMY